MVRSHRVPDPLDERFERLSENRPREISLRNFTGSLAQLICQALMVEQLQDCLCESLRPFSCQAPDLVLLEQPLDVAGGVADRRSPHRHIESQLPWKAAAIPWGVPVWQEHQVARSEDRGILIPRQVAELKDI